MPRKKGSEKIKTDKKIRRPVGSKKINKSSDEDEDDCFGVSYEEPSSFKDFHKYKFNIKSKSAARWRSEFKKQKTIDVLRRKELKKLQKEELDKESIDLLKVDNKNKEYVLNEKKYNFCVDDRSIPVFLIRNYINTHQLSKAIKLFCAILEDSRSCPFFICKTGNLLLKNLLETKVVETKNVFDKILNFNNSIKNLPLYPTIEIVMDFLNVGCELGYIDEVRNFIDSRKTNIQNKIKIEQVNLCYNSFDSFFKFYNFFQNLKEEKFDINLYMKDESKKQELQHVILSLENLVIGFMAKNCDYPLDYLMLCLIDILIIFKKKKKAKEILVKYYEKNCKNLNSIIYILKFNELFLNDENFFITYYDKLEELDPSNIILINYLDHFEDNFKKVKILLNFVDYTQNKENIVVWKLLSESLDLLNDEDKLRTKELYRTKFDSYWPNYQFCFKVIKVNNESCDYIYHKAKVFLFFDKDKSLHFVTIVSFILKSANNDKFTLLNNLTSIIEKK